MKIINGCRRSGKTYRMIEQMSTKDLYVASDMKRCRIAYDEWIELHKPERKDFNLPCIKQDIRPSFTTFDIFFSRSLRGFTFENVYIDNIDDYIEWIAYTSNIEGNIVCTSGADIEVLPIPESMKKIIKENPNVDIHLPEIDLIEPNEE